MKKFLAILAVLALTVISTAAMAEVTVSGSVDIRSLHQNNLTDFSDKAGDRLTTPRRSASASTLMGRATT